MFPSIDLRRDSFNLSDSEIETINAGFNIKFLLNDFLETFSAHSHILDEEKFDAVFDECIKNHTKEVYNIPLIHELRSKCDEITEKLKLIKTTMEEKLQNSNFEENWRSMIQQNFDKEKYLITMYCLIRLIDIDFKDKVNLKLSFASSQIYLLLLTLPGAKQCDVFNSSYIGRIFKMFEHYPRVCNSFSSNSSVLNDWLMFFSNVLNDIGVVFGKIGLREMDDVQNEYIDTVKEILECNLKSSLSNVIIYEISMKCHDLLEILCSLHHGEVDSTLDKIFCRTFDLHFLAPRKRSIPSSSGRDENIWDFFIYMLNRHPDSTTKVLTNYIQSILSNPDTIKDKNQLVKCLEVAVKYELAMYEKLKNKSVFKFLNVSCLDRTPAVRANSLDLLGKMLLVEKTSGKNENVTPREIFIVKLLFRSMRDKEYPVKNKVLSAIKTAFELGNSTAKAILHDSFDRKIELDFNEDLDEDRYVEEELQFDLEDSDNEPANPATPESEETPLEEDRDGPPPEKRKKVEKEIELMLPPKTIQQFKDVLLKEIRDGKQVNARKCCLEILEIVGKTDEELINSEHFKEVFMTLTDDPSIMIKDATLKVIDSFLQTYPMNQKLVNLYVDVILCLLKDDEDKIVINAINCLKGNLIDKINSHESSTHNQNFLPWKIMGAILRKGKRNVVMKVLAKKMDQNALRGEQLRRIENYIHLADKTESWAILSLIASKVESRNTEFVINKLLDLIDAGNFENVNLQLVLEIVIAWLDKINVHAIEMLATKLGAILKEGQSNITVIRDFYEILKRARKRIYGKDAQENEDFITEINEDARDYVISNMTTLRESTIDEKFLNFIVIYGETNADLAQQPDQRIFKYFLNFLKDTAAGKVSFSIRDDAPRKINLVLNLMTKFSVRDYETASIVGPILGKLLYKTIHTSVVKNVMFSVNNICKRFANTIDPIMKDIVVQLKSSNKEIRICTLENLYELILQDFIKLKGRVLLYILACVVDRDENVSLKATAIILNYAYDKNPILLYSCFAETIFVLNGYPYLHQYGVFSELGTENVLQGPNKKTEREQLYEFLVKVIDDLNENHLKMLFNQILLIHEMFEKDKENRDRDLKRPTIVKKTANGVVAFQDFLFAFTLVCNKYEDKRLRKEELGPEDEIAKGLAEIQQQQAGTADTSNQKGKRRNRAQENQEAIKKQSEDAIDKAIQIYPDFVKNLIAYDNCFKEKTKDLSRAIVKSFRQLVQYSKTTPFWNEFIREANAAGGKNKKTAKSKKNFIDDDSD